MHSLFGPVPYLTLLASLALPSSAQSTGEWRYVAPPGGDAQAVAASPTQPGLVLAAIGGTLSGSTSLGALFRSTDGGASWSQTLGWPQQSVYRMFDVAFGSNGTAWAAGDTGMWRSTDGGVTWIAMSIPAAGSSEDVLTLRVDPTNPDVVFAGLDQWQPPGHLIKTVNGGGSWTDVTPPLTFPMACRGIALDPADTQRVFAALSRSTGETAFFASSDGGATWSDLSAGLPVTHVSDLEHDGSRLFLSAGFATDLFSQGLYTSDDGGATWVDATDPSWPNPAILDVALDPAAPGVVYLGSHTGGVHRSIDGGATWQTSWGAVDAPSVLHVAVDPIGTDLWAGADGSAVWKKSGGGAFAPANDGIERLRVNSLDANPLDPDELAIGVGDWEGGSVFTSLDRGETWAREHGLPAEGFAKVRFAPNGTLYATKDTAILGPEGLWRRDGPGAWTALGPDSTPIVDFHVDGIAFDPADPMKIVMVGQDGTLAGHDPAIVVSTDGGATWTAAWDSGASSQYGLDVALVPDGTGLTYVASYTEPSVPYTLQEAHVVRSTDGGFTWTPLAGLPDALSPTRFAVTPAAPASVLVGNSKGGVWRSDDAGATFAAIPSGERSSTFFVAADATRVNLLWASGYNGDFVRGSLDAGATFADFGEGLDAGAAGGQDWANDFSAVDEQGCTLLLYASNEGAWIEETAGCTLFADTNEISLSAGGTQTLELAANADGSNHAGRLYHVLGSITGTTPGVTLMGVTIPLNPDPWFLFTANHPSQAPLGATLGTLDASGAATATISLPPAFLPTLAGLKLHHAYHAFELSPFFVTYDASNPEALTLVP